MALHPLTRDRIDAWMVLIAPELATRQASWLATHGRYWQGIVTPWPPPVEAADTDPDLSLHPTDQTEDWATFLAGVNVGKIPCSIRIDVYVGPRGMGYVVTVLTQSGGDRWQRSYNTGPETWRTTAWTLAPVAV